LSRGLRFDQLVEHLRVFTEVEMLIEPADGNPEVFHADIHRPGMALMGYTEGFHPERIQIVGETELGYLATLDGQEERGALRRVFNLRPAGIFLAQDLNPSEAFLEEAQSTGVPVARAALPTDGLVARTRDVLGELFALTTNKHATLVDVYGVGVLVTGRSGIGKSETALDLVERGHRLVADDIVVIKRRDDDVLMGRSRSNVEHLMEIRGLGVIDVFPLFGVRAIRMQKRIELELRLEEWDESKEYDRHGLDRESTEILGVKIPKVTVPIVPGKNNTVIAEIIALDFMLKTYGIDSADEFNRKLIKTMSDSGSTNRYLLHDPE
jgi:HPr kinase/phosphorylase